MTKTIMKYTTAALLAMGMMTSVAQAEDVAVSGDIGAYSQYVWRGVEQTVNSSAVQGDLGVSMGGLSAGVWFSNSYPASAPQYLGKDTVEFDWTLDYSGDIGDTGLGYSVGGIGYTYLYDSASNFPELYAGLSYGPASLTAYYNVADSQNKAYLAGDMWIDLGAGTSVAGFDVSGTVSYAIWKNDLTNRPLVAGVNTFKDGFSLATLGVSKDIDVAGTTMTPSLTYTYPLAKKMADGNKYIYGLPVKSEFIAGVNFSY